MTSSSMCFRQLSCREAPLAGAKQSWRRDRFPTTPSARQSRKRLSPALKVAQRSQDMCSGDFGGTVAMLSPSPISPKTETPRRSSSSTENDIRASIQKSRNKEIRQTYQEHERELEESVDDPGCSGRVGQVNFHGAAGRMGNYCHLGIGQRQLFRRHRLDDIRLELEEAESMNTILVGKRRQMLAKASRVSETRRSVQPSPGPSLNSSATRAAHGRQSQASPGQQQPNDLEPAVATAPRRRRSSLGNAMVQPGEEVGNVVAHNFDLSGSSIKRIMKPGFALSVAPGVILPILPNVMAMNGHLGMKEMEEMASERVLSSVLTLEVPPKLCSVSLNGDTNRFRRSIQFKAAALSRLVARAQQRHSPSYVILLQCWNPTMQPVAQLIAAWLHWYYHMGIEEACARAGAACGCYVPRSILDEANEDLYISAKIRATRGRLVWPHGAYLARVAGDVVGSWCPCDMKQVHRRDKELYGLKEKDWVLQLPELEPGQYRYKYVVDEHWRVDWKQPHCLDEHSNWNNIWEVPANLPKTEYTPERKLDVIRKEFMSLALRVKMKLEPRKLAK